ncbi:N-acyl homoserine lactonase family protein [Candidimonas humi]|uniref:N-acyl homoserine lactonase family protein n=1 Tax=Candidimonas humi TaxID=683355 RepID=A0ABV8NZ07_9BURK|nr:N-acyl homoserine lactonase family protein [Candidimonas humi]MBV6303929.1 N-acyl homoserine lactonase family protein [Candidimonas humi]
MNATLTEAVPTYEVYAIRYAHMPRMRRDNFIGGDPHDSAMPMDFFVWLLKSDTRTILVDTGFNAATAKIRDRAMIQDPIDALATVGVSPEEVEDVIITHLHYDHAGNLDRLPNARFHIQDAEVEYATGRCMCFAPMRHAFAVEDIVELVRHVYADRVVFHEGDGDVAPGVRALKIGGHTKGLQSVCVSTQRGQVVLASDASHYYENMDAERPFPIVYNVADMLAGYGQLKAVASSPDHIVPGHDPDVLKKYPAHQADINTCLLHLSPR